MNKFKKILIQGMVIVNILNLALSFIFKLGFSQALLCVGNISLLAVAFYLGNTND